ncbi:hypothetical protein PFF91_11565 [Burkholderia cenocepacia]|uniref:hypothetical protein n=1 Tax=Burkholderia cenocepacia TaxID=95486 RepID=UPI0022EB894C|nr:hypothetical protein [Burkholderia cenocepacia]MDA3670037.1 hypothetical protein [Burkholderia cenocepacia]MDA3680194.1 hypothetical protein [Burkholderia cenocepacia]MDA3684179.1 hypothetical protein [Burkholderia cenocepacia]MDA3691630.1 hypothetical protein [Burkholderia cenocepacia]MDA3702184.1 hypothetical protein [Burkholderia cenocepacia]
MILPPFDPPKLNDLTEWWTHCTYADVQRLILEVQHLRLTLWELKAHVADASRRIRVLDPDMLAHGSALRRLGYLLEKEIKRANPIGRTRDVYAPFSDEWRARAALRGALRAQPEPAEAGTLPCTIPEFQRITWAELRDRWRHLSDRKSNRQNVEQRMVLEIARQRSVILARARKLVDAAIAEAAADGKQLFALDQLKRLLPVEREDGEPFLYMPA